MIQPRGTLVVLELIEASERTQGAVVIPTHKDKMCEAIVVAFAPGNVAAAGGRSETHDLRLGQRVLVNHKQDGRNALSGQAELKPTYMPYASGGKTYALIEERYIFGILEQPTDPDVNENESRNPPGKCRPGTFSN